MMTPTQVGNLQRALDSGRPVAEIAGILDGAGKETAMTVTEKCACCPKRIGVGRSYSLPDMAPHCRDCWNAVKDDEFTARRLLDYHAARRDDQERRDANAGDCDL